MRASKSLAIFTVAFASLWHVWQSEESGEIPDSALWQVKHPVWLFGTVWKVPFFSQNASPKSFGGFVTYSSLDWPCGWYVWWQTPQFAAGGFCCWPPHRTLTKRGSEKGLFRPTTSRWVSCGKWTANSLMESRCGRDGSFTSPKLGNRKRTVLRGVTATWQFEQIAGAGLSLAKNCWRWQFRQAACSGNSATSAKAASPFRTSFQFAVGNLWHESHASFWFVTWVVCEKSA